MKKINEVFTPRSKILNKKMYINREYLEEELDDHLDGYKHIIIYGESGSGKTWLCKKILNDRNEEFGIINLNTVASNKSLKSSFEEKLADKLGFAVTEYQKNVNVGASAVFKAHFQETTKEVKLKGNPIKDYMDSFVTDKPIIILDNLESIFEHPDLMNELGNLLMLLDDEDYSARFIVIGVPAGVMNYFINRPALKPIANRIVELSEVESLNLPQVKEFVIKGFNEELNYSISDINLDKISNYMFWVTGGIPQQLHEFGEVLAKIIKRNSFIFKEDILEASTHKWLKNCLHEKYMVIADMMNSIETEVGRRNQILYCLGRIKNTTFTAQEIENILKSEFPKTTSSGKKLAVSTTLNDLVSWQNSFITRNKQEYIIKNKLYVLCIRAMLKKEISEKVVKITLQNVNQSI